MAAPKGRPKPEGSGRKKGTTNGDISKLRQLILGALDDVGGQSYLAIQAIENPGPFLALIGKVLPKEVKQELKIENQDLKNLSDEQLLAIATASSTGNINTP